MNAPQDFRNMTSASVGKDLLSALLNEIALLPDVWQKLPKAKQDDVIDRLRKRVEMNVKMAVHTLISQGRATVVGELEQITIKEGVKAVLRVSRKDPHFLDMCEAEGQSVLLVVASAEEHTGGMDEITGEADQRSFDLGREYTDNDGDGMPDNTHDDNVVDAEVIAIEDKPLEADLKKAYDDGYAAAQEGKPESDCPLMKGALCIQWVKGHQKWHEENQATETPQKPEADADGPKYRHPTNPNQTWSGRGRKPMWVVEWLDDGGTLEELEGNGE